MQSLRRVPEKQNFKNSNRYELSAIPGQAIYPLAGHFFGIHMPEIKFIKFRKQEPYNRLNDTKTGNAVEGIC
jgi:hypothetical protein